MLAVEVEVVGGGAPASGGGGTVAWFPLGPRDVYRPAYTVSREYFVNVNTSNTVVNNTIVTNVYENRSQPNVTYVNRQVPGALVALWVKLTSPGPVLFRQRRVGRAQQRQRHCARGCAGLSVTTSSPTVSSKCLPLVPRAGSM